MKEVIDKLNEAFLPQNLECDGGCCTGCWKDVVREAIKMIEQSRQAAVSGNEVALPFDKVTRLEVISYREGDKSGRVFTHWKEDNKIEGQLQDKDRTLKIFIDKRQ